MLPNRTVDKDGSFDVALEIVRSAVPLVAQPPVGFELLALLRSQQQTSDAIEVIRYDANLTAQLLRLCNSASTRGVMPIRSLDDAVMRLGFQTVADTVMAICFGKHFFRVLSDYGADPHILWRHSVATALAAQYYALCHTSDGASPGVNFTAGLLHDIGKVVLNYVPISGLGEIAYLVINEVPCYSAAEQRVLGTDHAAIGAALLEMWDLPTELVESTRLHNEPEANELAAIVRFSSDCANRCCDGLTQCDDPSISAEAKDVIAYILQHVEKIEAFMTVCHAAEPMAPRSLTEH